MAELASLAIAFLGAAVVGLAAQRTGQSVIPAYILAGALLGPHGPVRLVGETHLVEGVAELGLLFLLLFLGLEFSLTRFMESGPRLMRTGLIDLVVNFPLGVAIGLLLGLPLLASLFLGAIVYISSSAIAVKGLSDLRRLANPETETILGVLVFEDIAIAIVLAVLSGVALGGGGDPVLVGISVARALGFTLVFLGLARVATKPLDRFLHLHHEELFMLIVLALTLGVAAAAQWAGLSPAIGAFLFGLALSETARSHEASEFVVPMRDVFAAVFFFFFGMQMDLGALDEAVPLLLAAVPLTVAGKLLVGEVAGRLDRHPRAARRNVGAALVARGEFSIVAAEIAIVAGLPAVLGAFTGAYVLILAVVGPLLMQLTARPRRSAA